jgi:hypothetical protein
MANSTDTFWAVDGESLQTYAKNIETWGGDREAPPSLRGDDITIPNQPGDIWQPKMPEARVITLSMWVNGADDNGNRPTDGNRRALFEKNFKDLRRLLWTPRRQIKLTKRFRIYGTNTIVEAEAMAQYNGGLSPQMFGPHSAKFSVDLRLADPYFYALPKTLPMTGAHSLTVLGDDDTRVINLAITGSRQNVKIRNNTIGVEMLYNSSLLTGAVANIDVRKYTSVTTPGTGQPAFKSVGYVRHSGSPSWMVLRPGVNNLVLSSANGTGPTIMTYREAWL